MNLSNTDAFIYGEVKIFNIHCNSIRENVSINSSVSYYENLKQTVNFFTGIKRLTLQVLYFITLRYDGYIFYLLLD